MESVLTTPWPVFLGLTVALFGGAGFLTGQSLAQGWRPMTQVYLYGLLLGAGDRFLVFALFGGDLLSVYGFLLHSAVIIVIALVGYRITQAYRMVTQYPWLYERTGLFSWQEKPGARFA